MARKGIVVQYAVKWDEWDQTPDMTWEPPENLSNAKEAGRMIGIGSRAREP